MRSARIRLKLNQSNTKLSRASGDTKDYVHVIVAVDDGTLPRSISPLTRGFIKQKGEANHASPSQPVS